MKRIYALAIFGALFVIGLVSPAARAATLQVGESVSVPADQGDVYAAAGQVILDGAIEQDLVVAGGMISIDQDVKGDLLAAGGNIIVNADIGDDLRMAGGNISINGHVGGDVLVFGGTISFGSQAVIEGDIIAFGGLVVLNGDINGSVLSNAGDLTLRGNIRGSADLRAETLTVGGSVGGPAILVGSKSLNLLDDTNLTGDVRYWTERGPVDFGTAIRGQATYDRTLAVTQAFINISFWSYVLWAIALSIIWNAVLILVLVPLIKRPFLRAAEHLNAHLWMDLGLGALYIFVTPILAMVLMATVIGLPIGGLIMLGYFASLFLAKTLPAIVLTRWLELRTKQKWSNGKVLLISLGLMLVLQLLGLIPIVGWLANIAAVLFTFGALLVAKYEIFKKVA